MGADVQVFGVVGYKNNGKTTLIERMVAALGQQGLRVSTIKHVHHDVDFDTPGKDSDRHRQAGAVEVLVAGPLRWALLHEHRDAEAPELAPLLARMSPVDLVLVEGFKRHGHPKIEVHRAAQGMPLLAAEDPTIVAVASDEPLPGLSVPVFPLDDVDAAVALVLAQR